jgi:hypothetical protein
MHKLQLFQGIYENIPSAANFKSKTMAVESIHYPGILVGYMAWGFIICSHLIFFLFIVIGLLPLKTPFTDLVVVLIVPLFVIYLLKTTILSTAADILLFVRDVNEKLNLRNRKMYAVFVSFNFFAGKI